MFANVEPDTPNVNIDAVTADEPLWSPIELFLNTSTSDVTSVVGCNTATTLLPCDDDTDNAIGFSRVYPYISTILDSNYICDG